ncbi:hypothetical protein HID58_037801, partial [Brassica napus]
PKKSMWKIRVKVIRLWKHYSAAAGETMEMVLVDAKGDKIRASIKKELVCQFDPFFSQGCSKLIFNFSLTPSCGQPIILIKLGFFLQPDVIGQIVEVSHVKVVSVNSKDTQKISLELRDSNDERLSMVLWGRFAVDVSDAIQLRKDRSISNAYNVSDVSLNPSMAEVDAFIQL